MTLKNGNLDMFNSRLSEKSIKTVNEGDIYPVYINSKVIPELINFCKETYPKEALAFLVGIKALYKNDLSVGFTRVTDWVTGSVDSTHISANFTTEGLQQANIYLDDKYGVNREKHSEIPKIIGIVHSHPFNAEPHFSSTDLDSFLNFPYDDEGNVFILIDPVNTPPFFKVFKILKDELGIKTLQHVPWMEYSAIKSEFDKTDFLVGLKENGRIEVNSHQDDAYTPPKIEDLDKKNVNKHKSNLDNFFS